MSTDQAETFSAEPPAQEKKKSGGCLKGCLIALVVFVVLAVVAGYFIASNFKNLAASFGTTVIQQVLTESGLPAEEQAEVMVEIERVAEAFKSGELSNDEMGALIQELVNSPVMTTFVILGVERGYLDKSGLSDEEKAAGSTALRRFARGYLDGSLDEGAFDELMAQVADRDDKGQWQVREPVTDEALRALIAAAQQKADEAGVPAEVEPIDPSDEIKKIVDAALSPADP